MEHKAFETTAKKTFDYNQFPIKILTGVRGSGKTYPVHEYLLNNYLKKGEFFVCLRESQEEVDNMLSGSFWDSYLLSNEKYNNDFRTIGNKIIIDDVIVGYCIALTTYGKFRGAVSPVGLNYRKTKREKELEKQLEETEDFIKNNEEKTTSAFFDEFIPITPQLTDEKRFNGFMHFLETVFRFRKKTNVFLCGNLVKPYDIFLKEFNFKQPLNIEYGIKKSYTLPIDGYNPEPLAVWNHLKPNEEWKKLRNNSIVGKISRGKQNDMFLTGNAYKMRDIPFMPIKPLPRAVCYHISDGEKDITYWRNNKGGFYLTERSRSITNTTYVFDIKRITSNQRLIPKVMYDALIANFENGNIQFDNVNTYEFFTSLLSSKKYK